MTDDTFLPLGFRVAGRHCGIKSDARKPDLSLFVSDQPAVSAGVFTTNRIVGAPVTISRERIGRESSRAIVINSGNANACTGQRGLDDAKWMTELVADSVGGVADDVLLCSTGIIGHYLPRPPLESGIPAVAKQLSDSVESIEAAARGMMTTDTFAKCRSERVRLSGGEVTLTAFTKGAAMIAPNMATMLSVVLTDAVLAVDAAQELLAHAVNRSFNCISVDGHMSTSDSVLLLANGAATVDASSEDDRDRLQTALSRLCEDQAQQIIRDAEGAAHFVTVKVSGLNSAADANAIAKEVAESALVKTAVTGNDPNWGRIVSAAGYAGVPFKDEECSLLLNGVCIYESGMPAEYDAAALSASMSEGDVTIDLRFTLGDEGTTWWTSDLTAEYVRLNSEYTT